MVDTILVSNSFVSTNPDIPVAKKRIGGGDFQYVIPCDNSGNPSTTGFFSGQFDRIELTYTGDNLTGVVYKLSGTTIATLTLSYSGSNLTTVVKT